MLENTYESIETIKRFILNAQNRRYLTSGEFNALKDFMSNADDLNAQRKGKTMRPEQEQFLREINDMSKEAGKALKQFNAYDEPQMSVPQLQRTNPNNPWRGRNPARRIDPAEDPIYYQNI